MTDRDAFDRIQSATILKPGDRVLIECERGARQSDVGKLLGQLKEFFPDVMFFVMSSARAAMVEAACTCPPLDVTAMGDEPKRVLAPSYDPACPAHT